MSCNGCRVLRKGCSKNCIFRSSLQWIAQPDAQANATLFLVKSYGRVGLINLIASAPEPLHPDVFKSLLYDACGRVIDPIGGAMGLMCSGEWSRCEAAVAAVLRGEPIMQLSLLNPNITLFQLANHVHNTANEAGLNNAGSFSTQRIQPPFVDYFEHPDQTLDFELGSSSSSSSNNNNNNNQLVLDLSLGGSFATSE